MTAALVTLDIDIDTERVSTTENEAASLPRLPAAICLSLVGLTIAAIENELRVAAEANPKPQLIGRTSLPLPDKSALPSLKRLPTAEHLFEQFGRSDSPQAHRLRRDDESILLPKPAASINVERQGRFGTLSPVVP